MKEFRSGFVPLFVAVDAIGANFHCVSIATPLTLALLKLGHRRLRSPYPSYATTR